MKWGSACVGNLFSDLTSALASDICPSVFLTLSNNLSPLVGFVKKGSSLIFFLPGEPLALRRSSGLDYLPFNFNNLIAYVVGIKSVRDHLNQYRSNKTKISNPKLPLLIGEDMLANTDKSCVKEANSFSAVSMLPASASMSKITS